MLLVPAGSLSRESNDVLGLDLETRPIPRYQKTPRKRSFLIADSEVSKGLFEQFIDDAEHSGDEKPKDWRGVDSKYSPTAEHPAQNVSWYDAVLFCNWLSIKEGLKPCYRQAEAASSRGCDSRERDYDAWQRLGMVRGLA